MSLLYVQQHFRFGKNPTVATLVHGNSRERLPAFHFYSFTGVDWWWQLFTGLSAPAAAQRVGWDRPGSLIQVTGGGDRSTQRRSSNLMIFCSLRIEMSVTFTHFKANGWDIWVNCAK